jgi:serine protease Do
MQMLHALLLHILFFPVATYAAPASLDGRAQAVFSTVKDSVLQIRTLLKGSQSQNSIGSGFYVSNDGLVITNYHVVSSYALEPDIYEMGYVASSGERGTLTLLAVDVLHDLALLQLKGSKFPNLRFHEGRAGRGEKLFSLGNPNDLGLVIVEGVNNGLREHSFYDSIHFTGAINPGMSGGPVVNQSGELVGINVATMGESRGFLVPAQFAQALLARRHKEAVAPAELRAEVTRQLIQHSSALITRLMKKPLPVQFDAGYTVPDAADPYMNCWASESTDKKLFFNVRSNSCQGSSDVYVGQDINMGSVQFDSMLYQSDKLDSFRFGRLLQRSYGVNDESSYEIQRKHYTKYECADTAIDLNGMPAKAALCIRAYRKFKGLYDFSLKVVSLRESKRALVTKLRLRGVAFDDGMRMVRHYMGALKWKG